MLSPVVEKQIHKYYLEKEGNPAGIEVAVLGINTDQTSASRTDEFVDQVGFEVVVDDPEWVAYGEFGPGGAASRYVIINGVADSPTHKQWEVLFNETFFQPDEVTLLRALIDKVKAPVPAPPKIAFQPLGQTVSRGTTVTLTVSASGTAPLSFQWYRNGAPIPGATDKSIVVANITAAEAGDYSVVVSNRFGSETSQSIAVKVIDPIRPVLSGVRRLEDGSLEFVLSGEPKRDYHIEFSTDLKSWRRVMTVNLDQPKVTYREPSAAAALQGFIRAASD